MKYEEDIEEGGQRWSKPYVSAIQLSACNELRRILENAEVHLDFECDNEEKASRVLVEAWTNSGAITESERPRILQTLLRPHVHLYETNSSLMTMFKKQKTPPPTPTPTPAQHTPAQPTSNGHQSKFMQILCKFPEFSLILQKIYRNSPSPRP